MQHALSVSSQRLRENLDAARLKLTPEDLAEVRAVAQAADASGSPRYPQQTGLLFGDTPTL